jgi:cyclophilin family peptidyl-prolyl cis-trans isomerase
MKKALVLCLLFYTILSIAQAPGISVLRLKAPETFKAVFKTNKGEFVIEVYRKWSPLGADRIYQLVKSGFFSDALFFRVEQDFVVQFGISANYAANRFWDPRKLPDEPALQKNTRGIISFARGGRNNRTTQIFINMADNVKLDTAVRNGIKGYTPVAKVVKGMEVLARLNSRYGKAPAVIQDSLYKYGNRYFEQQFPGLDKILSAAIIK